MYSIPKNFPPELAVKLSKIVHDKCENVPHDIGIDLARAAREYYNELEEIKQETREIIKKIYGEK